MERRMPRRYMVHTEKQHGIPFNYEVKTISPDNEVGTNFKMLAKGMKQATNNAKGKEYHWCISYR